MENLLENDAFCIGMSVGLAIYQQKIIVANERKESIRIGDNLYYVQDGRERLKEVIDKICE